PLWAATTARSRTRTERVARVLAGRLGRVKQWPGLRLREAQHSAGYEGERLHTPFAEDHPSLGLGQDVAGDFGLDHVDIDALLIVGNRCTAKRDLNVQCGLVRARAVLTFYAEDVVFRILADVVICPSCDARRPPALAEFRARERFNVLGAFRLHDIHIVRPHTSFLLDASVSGMHAHAEEQCPARPIPQPAPRN